MKNNFKKIKFKKIDWTVIVYFLLLLMAFKPAYFSQISFIDRVFDLGKISVFIIGVLGVAKSKFPPFLIYIALYCFTIFFSTLINRGNYIEAITLFASSIGISSLIITMYKKNSKKLWKALILVFEFLIYGNLITVIIAPQGLYRMQQETGWWTDACWFLGIRNGMAPVYIIGMFLEILNVFLDESSISKKIRCIAYIIVSSLTVIKINISTTMISAAGSAAGLILMWVLVIGYFILKRFEKILKFWDLLVAVIANLVFMVLLVGFQIQQVFSYIIVTLLHKDITMSLRTRIWENAISAFKQSPWLGYGIESGSIMAERLGNAAASSTTQNGWLDILYKGGIISFICILAILFFLAFFVRKKKLNSKMTFLIGYMSALYMFSGQTESLVNAKFFAFMTIIYVAVLTVENTRIKTYGREMELR